MSFEIPESAFITIRQPIPPSQLPTRGWARVYSLDEDTNAICIKEVPYTQLSPKQTYDTVETDAFRDDVAAQGFTPRITYKFYIVFPEELRTGFRRVVEICRGLPLPDPTTVEAADSAVRATAGISLLASPLMRELLLFIALVCNNLPSRKTSRQAQTIATIASAGPPSTEYLTTNFRTYMDDLADGGGFLHPRAELALLKGGWRRPKHGSLQALWGLKEDTFAGDAHLEDNKRDLLRELIKLDYVQVSTEPNGMAPELLRRLAQQGSVTVLRSILGDGGVLPVERVPAELRADMLLTAVAAASDEQVPDRHPMIAYLLDEVGIDPNSEGSHWAGTKPGQHKIRQTALHIAMGKGDDKTANLLLERGASAEARDEEGRTPLERGSPV